MKPEDLPSEDAETTAAACPTCLANMTIEETFYCLVDDTYGRHGSPQTYNMTDARSLCESYGGRLPELTTRVVADSLGNITGNPTWVGAKKVADVGGTRICSLTEPNDTYPVYAWLSGDKVSDDLWFSNPDNNWPPYPFMCHEKSCVFYAPDFKGVGTFECSLFRAVVCGF